MKSLTSWPLTPASGPRSRCGRRRQGSGTTCAGGARRREPLPGPSFAPAMNPSRRHGVEDGCGHRRLLPGLRSTVTVGAGDLSFGPTTASRVLRLTRKQAVSSVRDRITPASDEQRESRGAVGARLLRWQRDSAAKSIRRDCSACTRERSDRSELGVPDPTAGAARPPDCGGGVHASAWWSVAGGLLLVVLGDHRAAAPPPAQISHHAWAFEEGGSTASRWTPLPRPAR